MEDDFTTGSHVKKSPHAVTKASHVWLLGGAVIVIATFLCYIMFTTKERSLPVPNQNQEQEGIIMSGGGRQAAFVPPNCVTCPSAPQCFPPATTGAQQIAYAPNCAQAAAYTPGCAQQVALARPVYPMRAQSRALSQNTVSIKCPRCNSIFNDPYAESRGYTQCPRCQFKIRIPGVNSGGLAPVALTQPVAPPPIFRDAVMIHKFRGVCENCHIVKPDIAIPASATQMHAFRGVCSNCHTILGLNGSVK